MTRVSRKSGSPANVGRYGQVTRKNDDGWQAFASSLALIYLDQADRLDTNSSR